MCPNMTYVTVYYTFAVACVKAVICEWTCILKWPYFQILPYWFGHIVLITLLASWNVYFFMMCWSKGNTCIRRSMLLVYIEVRKQIRQVKPFSCDGGLRENGTANSLLVKGKKEKTLDSYCSSAVFWGLQDVLVKYVSSEIFRIRNHQVHQFHSY